MKLDKFSRRQADNDSRNFNNAKRIVPSFLRAQQGEGMEEKEMNTKMKVGAVACGLIAVGLIAVNAAKGSLGSKGSIVKGASLGAAFQAASELGQKMDELKGAKKELGKVWSGMKSEVKKGMSEAMGDGIKDLKKSMDELDAAADALKNLGN